MFNSDVERSSASLINVRQPMSVFTNDGVHISLVSTVFSYTVYSNLG